MGRSVCRRSDSWLVREDSRRRKVTGGAEGAKRCCRTELRAGTEMQGTRSPTQPLPVCDAPPPTPRRKHACEKRVLFIQSGSSGNDVFFNVSQKQQNSKKKCTFNSQKEESLGKWRCKLLWVPHVFYFLGTERIISCWRWWHNTSEAAGFVRNKDKQSQEHERHAKKWR